MTSQYPSNSKITNIMRSKTHKYTCITFNMEFGFDSIVTNRKSLF